MSSSQSPSQAAAAPLRTLGDPHALRPFRRIYLGPTPVPTASAATLAQAIANDADASTAVAATSASSGGLRRQASSLHVREQSVGPAAVPLGLLVAGARPSDGHNVGIVGHVPPPPPSLPTSAQAGAKDAFGSVNSKASFVKNPAAGESPFKAAAAAAAGDEEGQEGTPTKLAIPPQLAIITTSPSQPVSPISPGTVPPLSFSLPAPSAQPSSAASGISSFSSTSTFLPSRRGLIAREQSATSFASFTSAQSLPDSVLSEGDVLSRQRAEESPYRPPVRRDVSAYAALGSEATSAAATATPHATPPPGASVPAVTLAPSTSFHSRRLSFEVPDERPSRRGRSEGASEALPLLDLPLEEEEDDDDAESTPSTPRQRKREASVASQTTPSKRGLLVPSSEGGTPPSTPRRMGGLLRRPHSAASLLPPSPLSGSPAASSANATPTAVRQRRSFIRSTPGGSTSASSTLTRAQGRALARRSIGSYDEAAAGGGAGASVMQGATFDEELQAAVNAVPSALTNGSTSAAGVEASPTREAHEAEADLRISLAKARARERFAAVRVGGRTSGHGFPHPRDASRASRMSRASTAGSFATRATDASFTSAGATGMRERFMSAFGAGGGSGASGSAGGRMPSRTRSRTQQSMGSVATAQGAAVGTSAGGTKWVGGTFEVGARFFEVLEARRASAPKERQALGPPLAELGAAQARPKASPQATTSGERKAVARSPSDVLNSFAREASEEAEEKREKSGDVLDQVGEEAQLLTKSPDQVLFPEKPLASEPQADALQTPKKSSVRLHLPVRTTAPGTPKSSAPAPSLLSIPHAKGAAHDSTFVIESRQGWADLVSLMSAHGSGVGVTSSSSSATTAGAASTRKPFKALTKLAPGAWPTSTTPATTMTSAEASQHPDPPSGAEDRFPEATHELLRRQSYIGTPPNGLRDETASDTKVVIVQHQQEQQQQRNEADAATTTAPSEAASASVAATPSPRKRKDSSSSFKNTLLRSFGAGGSTPVTPTRKTVQFEGAGEAKPAFTRGLSATLAAKMGGAASKSAGALTTAQQQGRAATGDSSPAPPEEVLARPGESVSGATTPTATGSNTPALAEEFLTRKTELKRDRMLVKVGWTPHSDVPRDFDELSARRHNVYSDAWREYMVVLRQGRLELWDDPSFTSRALGHPTRLKQRFIVPLKKGSTFLSVYSAVDRIFCLSYGQGDAGHKGKIHLRRNGTHVVLFDCRARTVAADWMWELWRELGGEIPRVLDIHMPAIDVRVRVPIPEEVPDEFANEHAPSVGAALTMRGEGFKIMTKERLLSTVLGLAKGQPDWCALIELATKQGIKFELAWRTGTTLDWVRENQTVSGETRDWAVLCGQVVKESRRTSVLEIRDARHYPTTVRSVKGDLIEEPPAIEGYLWRVKPVSGALTRTYATTHDGHVFVCRPSRACAPDRHLATGGGGVSASSGTITFDRQHHSRHSKRAGARDEALSALRAKLLQAAGAEAEEHEAAEAFRALERRRQLDQITRSDGYVDLRDVDVIRSCGAPSTKKPAGDEKDAPPAASADDNDDGFEDEDDAGGEEALSAADDRGAAKRSRQFEVVMSTGAAIKFEAYSASVAKEWIERLTALAQYWKRRERVDALELMNVTGYDPSTRRRQQQRRDAEDDDEPAPALGVDADPEVISPMLSNVWNWCTMQACRGIIRCGRLFFKRKAFTTFASRYYILIGGRLLAFKLVTSTRTARGRQNAGVFHRRQPESIHLRDAYVYSGKLSEEMLVRGRSEGAGAGGGSLANSTGRHRLPRVYRDGLLSVDEDEDCTFVLRYRSAIADTPQSAAALPALGDKAHKHLVLRARCKLERDIWVRAITLEIERIVREDSLREGQLRNAGKTAYK